MTQRKPRSWPSIGGSESDRAKGAFRRLEDVTRLISDWVFETDVDNRISYVSERSIDRLGLHPVQMTGKRLDEIGTFQGHGGEAGPAPDFRRPFRDVRFEAVGRDDQPRHFSISAMPQFDQASGDFIGATGIARDVTELVRVERANVRLADAIEMLSGYFALYDENDKLVISNARFREFNRDFGTAASPGGDFETLLRQEIESGRYPDAVDDPEGWLRRRQARRERTSGPFELPMSGGRYLLVDEARIPDGGTVYMARDITEMKRAMQALRASARQHSDFAANVAHKLRTPLAVLRANLDRLGGGEEVLSLKHEVDVLARMVEQLLTLTRYQNMVPAADAEADLHRLALDVVSNLAPVAIKEGRTVELEGETKPIVVHGDPGALEHAVRNLVDNAIKYSARGTSIRVILDRDPAKITVLDRGRGIPLEARAQLFESFGDSDRRGAGAGLGLHIVKTIVDAHGAEISVGENAEGGSVFAITFRPDRSHLARSARL